MISQKYKDMNLPWLSYLAQMNKHTGNYSIYLKVNSFEVTHFLSFMLFSNLASNFKFNIFSFLKPNSQRYVFEANLLCHYNLTLNIEISVI